jgi:hypothetical protein
MRETRDIAKLLLGALPLSSLVRSVNTDRRAMKTDGFVGEEVGILFQEMYTRLQSGRTLPAISRLSDRCECRSVLVTFSRFRSHIIAPRLGEIQTSAQHTMPEFVRLQPV